MSSHGQESHGHHHLKASDRLVLEQKHQFVRDDEVDAGNAGDWGVRMAAKSYRQLFKEYAIVDLSQFAAGHVGMRWRIEKEVLSGKGQTICGNKVCVSAVELHSYEIPFAYEEHGEHKHELVKVRVCLECARKLFHDKLRRLERDRRKKKKNKRPQDDAASSSEEQYMSHDDIVRALFDVGKAECKEDDSDGGGDDDNRHHSHKRTKRKDDDDGTVDTVRHHRP